jgi:hypothetical protein
MFSLVLWILVSVCRAKEPAEKEAPEVEIGGEVAVAREGREDSVRLELEGGVALNEHFFMEISAAEELPIVGDEEPFLYALVGPAWKAGKRFTLRIGVGMETSEVPFRAGLSARYESDKFNVSGVLEYGHSGVWHREIATVRFGPMDIGVHAQMHHGVGPTCMADIKYFHPWVTPMVGMEKGSFLERLSLLAGVIWTPGEE